MAYIVNIFTKQQWFWPKTCLMQQSFRFFLPSLQFFNIFHPTRGQWCAGRGGRGGSGPPVENSEGTRGAISTDIVAL